MKKIPDKIFEYMAAKNFNKWKKILTELPEIHRILSKLEGISDLHERLNMICVGYVDNGFTLQEIELFANPKLTYKQAENILDYLEGRELNYEQIKIFAKPKFNVKQMIEIANAIIEGVSINKVKLFAKPEFNHEQMLWIYYGLEKKLTVKQVMVYANLKFNSEQMRAIMYSLVYCEEGKLSYEQVEFIADERFNSEQMKIIQSAFLNGRTIEEIREYADTKYDEDQMKTLINAWGIPKDKLDLLANPKLSYMHMVYLLDAIKREAPDVILNKLASTKLNDEQAYAVSIAIRDGLSTRQIMFVANPKFDSRQMSVIMYGLKHDVPIAKIKIFANPKFNNNQMKEILDAILDKYTEEQIAVFAKPQFYAEQMKVLKKVVWSNLTKEQIAKIANPHFNADQMKQILSCIKQEFPEDIVDLVANPKLTYYNMDTIIHGYKHGNLTYEQLELCAQPQFGYEKMHNTMLCFKAGMTAKQFKEFKIEQLSNHQVVTIYDCLSKNFSEKQVEFIVKRVADRMPVDKYIKAMAAGLTEEQIDSYCPLNLNETTSDAILECYKVGMSIEDLNGVINYYTTASTINNLRVSFERKRNKEELIEIYNDHLKKTAKK